MDEFEFDEWEDPVPWWADAPTDAELDSAQACTDPAFQLSPAALLAEAEQAGPGPVAQCLLAALTGRELFQDQWLTAVQLWEAQEAWLAGQKALAVAGFAGPTPVTVAGFRDDEALTLELALGLGRSDAFAHDQIVQARLLSSTSSATGDLLRAGRLSPYRARLIAAELGELHPDIARQVEAKVLDTAAQVPTGLLRKQLVRHSKRLAREAVNDRRVAELAERTPGRRVVFDPDAGDGLMGMYAYLPPVEALAMQQALKAAAGAFRTADGRQQKNGKADPDMHGPGAHTEHPAWLIKLKVKVGVPVDLPNLLGLRDNDCELLGDATCRPRGPRAGRPCVLAPNGRRPGHRRPARRRNTVHDLPPPPGSSRCAAPDRFPGGTVPICLDLDHARRSSGVQARGSSGAEEPVERPDQVEQVEQGEPIEPAADHGPGRADRHLTAAEAAERCCRCDRRMPDGRRGPTAGHRRRDVGGDTQRRQPAVFSRRPRAKTSSASSDRHRARCPGMDIRSAR